MRLNRYGATASGLSRRAADTAIADGRVKVAGAVATLGHVLTGTPLVQLDDRPLFLPTTFTYVIVNKPRGVVVSRRSQDAAATVYALLPDGLSGLKPVGRLDKDSTGLLLLTDDGEFANAAAHPSSGKTKTYDVTLDLTPTTAQLDQLAAGVTLTDGISRLAVTAHHGRELTVTLQEGRNRQIRRTFEATGLTVTRLDRTGFGALTLPPDLTPGSYRLVEGRPEV